MITRRRIMIAAGMASLVGGAFMSSLQQPLAAPPTGFTLHREPFAVPPLVFQSDRGQALSLDDFRGQLILLNLWATWCAPCRAEMPALDHLQANLGGPDFEVLALSVDREGVAVVQPFYHELELEHLAIYIDTNAAAQRLLRVFGLPTTLLINEEGQELGRMIGPAKWDGDDMIAFLRSMIGRSEDQPDLLIEETKLQTNNIQ